jgi:hypothetical protein
MTRYQRYDELMRGYKRCNLTRNAPVHPFITFIHSIPLTSTSKLPASLVPRISAWFLDQSPTCSGHIDGPQRSALGVGSGKRR